MPSRYTYESFILKLKSSVLIDDKTGCWNWQKATKNGYAVTSKQNVQKLAHREMLKYSTGLNPDKNILACHKCDNPKCINPDHLFWGTSRENRQDMFNKNRQPDFKKIRRAMSKLSKYDVNEIRFLRKNGDSLNSIASKFGISFQQVSKICLNQRWS